MSVAAALVQCSSDGRDEHRVTPQPRVHIAHRFHRNACVAEERKNIVCVLFNHRTLLRNVDVLDDAVP
jgi:hypothetical protein